MPTENDEVHLHTFSQGQVKIQKYIAELMNEHHECHDEMSELEFLCEILKVNTEKGLKDIIERCLMQFTIEIITEGIGL